MAGHAPLNFLATFPLLVAGKVDLTSMYPLFLMSADWDVDQIPFVFTLSKTHLIYFAMNLFQVEVLFTWH